MGHKDEKTGLTQQQEKFCQTYCSPDEFFGNGTQSYMEAYNKKMTKHNLSIAKSGAYENLKKPHILRRIDELLSKGGLNDQAVDKQLDFLIKQKAEMGVSLGAIKEYNKLRGRITDKIEAKGLILSIQSGNPEDQKVVDKIV